MDENIVANNMDELILVLQIISTISKEGDPTAGFHEVIQMIRAYGDRRVIESMFGSE